ncbi:MAG: ABC transporter permease [Oscillospiraceae bacterium]|nr:ABC transporter permease [Oscillospiraceae bacterium]
MLRYLGKRLISLVVVFFIISIVLFGVFRLMGGDPVSIMIGDSRPAGVTYEAWEQMRQNEAQRLGLDQPLPIQYFRWITDLLQGDLGFSITHRRPVTQVLPTPIQTTLLLNSIVMLLTFLIAIPLGITTAVKKGSVYDSSVQTSTLLGFSLPMFITAIVGIMVFSVWLGWLPVSGFGTPGLEGSAWTLFWDRMRFLALPIMILTFAQLAPLTRYIRVAMIDALSQDYTRTARAKGLGEVAVIYKHAFRNSQIPFVTSLMGWILSLIGGTIVIETIFSINGMGGTFISALNLRDYNLALAISMLFTIIALVGYIILDFIYVLVDPRVRLD